MDGGDHYSSLQGDHGHVLKISTSEGSGVEYCVCVVGEFDFLMSFKEQLEDEDFKFRIPIE